jgi:hypothetical protein
MNVFIYDSFLDKYKKKLRKVEKILNELNLQGKIIYLKEIKNLENILKKELESGAKTIITVGNNKTLNDTVNILANISENIPISIIPIGPNNSIAYSLGILNEKEACFILSSRRIKTISLAQANNLLFIKNCLIKSKGTTIYINDSYQLISEKKGSCFIYNIPPKEQIFNNIKLNPKDNLLALYIKTKTKGKTHLLAEKIEIRNKKETAILDDLIPVETPINLSSSNKKILLIVGKERSF